MSHEFVPGDDYSEIVNTDTQQLSAEREIEADIIRPSRQQIMRLVRLGKDFNSAVAALLNGQHIIQEHRDLVDLIRRQDVGSIKGRF